MKVKHGVIFLVLGYILTFVGALFKLMHWPYASPMLIIATFFEVVGSIILLYKLLTYPKVKEFLNW
ncbi:MAG TPA: gliding motility protein GldL [Flavobacterium sp.]|jgi:hypothetical protein